MVRCATGLIPTPIQASQLSDAQHNGLACIWCKIAIQPGTREHVGSTGQPLHKLWACLECVLTKRLPVFPEYGAC